MRSIKTLKTLLLVASLLGMTFLFSPSASAETTAGCPGGPAGPPSAGAVCEDGSVPVPDPSLPPGCPGSAQQGPPSPGTVCPAREGRAACTIQNGGCPNAAANRTSINQSGTLTPDCKSDQELNQDNCRIVKYIVGITNVLSAAVGIVVVIMIAVGGLQYTMARDDAQAIAAAKNRIKNAIFALIFYLFGFAFLQYLIPGGLF